MLEYIEYVKTHGDEPYLYYSRNALNYKLEISRNKEKSRDMDTCARDFRVSIHLLVLIR